VQESEEEEDPGDRILSVGGMWWRKCVGGQSFGRNVWMDAECTRLLRKACGADAMRQAEESSGVLAESQAFLSTGKRGLSGHECTKF
jgi:hypothetical protein